MKIWMIVAVCAFVFLVCFLLDTLFKHLFPKSKLEKSKRPCARAAERDVRRYFAVRAGRGAAVFHAEGRRYAAAHRLHRGADFRRDPVGELFFRHHLL